MASELKSQLASELWEAALLSNRTYPMKCDTCSTKAMFVDLDDAYDEGWLSTTKGEHCPEHVTEEDFEHDYKMKCAYCKEEGLFKDLDDALENGWWRSEGCDVCDECVDTAMGATL